MMNIEDDTQPVSCESQSGEAQAGEARVPGWLAALVLAALFVAAGLGGYFLRDVFSPQESVSGTVYSSEIEKWSQVVADHPDSVSARLSLAYAYQNDRQYDLALEQYSEVLRTEPSNPTALYHQGVIYLDLKLDDQGEASLWRVLDAEPDHVQASAALGRFYAAKGHYRSVVAAVRPAAVAHPGSAELQYLMGFAYENLGNSAWATERYRMALAAAPDYIEAREGLARLERLGFTVPQ